LEKFAFVMHPLSAKRDIARKYPFVKHIPEPWLEFALRYKSPMMVSHVDGIKSITGVEAEGWFVGCPLTPHQLLNLPREEVYRKLIKTIKIAEDAGAKIVGLGAFTSVVGDGGITIRKGVNIAVTTGNSYTVATAIEGSVKAAELMGISVADAHVAIVGATGSIGKTCAQAFSRLSSHVSLVGRNREKLQTLADDLAENGAGVGIETDVEAGIRDADIVVTVSSAVDAIIEPHYIKKGAVVCDVARPRDVSARVTKERDDVLVIEGGVVKVPGKPDFHFSFGFPPETAYACMSETIMLALDQRYEDFTLGKDVTLEQVDTISAIALKHGFKLAGFRSFEKAVTDEKIADIRKKAGR